MAITKTSTREFLASISDWFTRSRGGHHLQHKLGRHHEKPNPLRCDLCRKNKDIKTISTHT